MHSVSQNQSMVLVFFYSELALGPLGLYKTSSSSVIKRTVLYFFLQSKYFDVLELIEYEPL